MTGIKGNKGHANKTSFPNQKNNKKCPKVILRKFQEMYNNTCTDRSILCFQDACHSIGWRSSKIDYWVNKLPIFESYKRDIQNAIVRRVNSNALEGDYNATASIWRMKQLGEKDQQYQDLTSNGKDVSIPLVDWVGGETSKDEDENK